MTLKHNITREKRKPSSNPKGIPAPKRIKSTHTFPPTPSPDTSHPKLSNPPNLTPSLESHLSSQPIPRQFPQSSHSSPTPQPQTTGHHPTTHHADTTNPQDLTSDNPHTNNRSQPRQTHTINHLIDNLKANAQHIITQILALSDDRTTHNYRGSRVTKRQLLHCTWGEHTESDNLQFFQQAILTTLPPSTTTITQYTTFLTSAICMDNTVWQHNIHNACQDQTLSHPLFNPITIFNIHHNNQFTTLITDNHTFYHYDLLNLRPPPAINQIYNTLRQ
jgi:hypothetical protein